VDAASGRGLCELGAHHSATKQSQSIAAEIKKPCRISALRRRELRRRAILSALSTI